VNRPIASAAACLCLAWLLPSPATVRADDDGRWLLGADSFFYSDSDNVLVWTSQALAKRQLDRDGSEVSARAVVDVVSAASVDVVSHATTGFDEVRLEGNLAAALRFGELLPALHYRVSREPDYESHGFGGGLSARLGSADSVGSVDYTVTLDTVGRTDTPRALFSEHLQSHAAEVGLSQNLDQRTVLRGAYTMTLQQGYLEKPYRFVPIFARADVLQAQSDGVELGLHSFERYYSVGRPAESVPDSRLRHALGLRLLRYLDSIDGSLRLDYRFYIDDWLLQAHTLEAALQQPLGEDLELAVFVRGYGQSGASFWERVYVVDDAETLPRHRTLDRKLSPYGSLTTGARMELRLGPLDGYLDLRAMATHFFDYLLLSDRIALISQLGVSWTP